MHKFTYPSKDAYITNDTNLEGKNFGLDEILQVGTTIVNDIVYINRALVKFDLTEISKSIVSGQVSSPKFFLNLKVCEAHEVPIDYSVYALPVSQSWNMGNGYYSDGGSDMGVSWNYRDVNGGSQWYDTYMSGTRPAIDFINNPSLASSSFQYGGGTWQQPTICSQSFSYETGDIRMDVTPIVTDWLNGTYNNEGFLIVSSDELEMTSSGYLLKFFSHDTNTIYSPYLDSAWNDATFVTGSVTTSSVTISQINAGLSMSIVPASTFSMPNGVSGSFSASAALTITQNSASGFITGFGLGGNIAGLPIIGLISGSLSDMTSITGPCGNVFSAQILTASLYSGYFSGSSFTAYYQNYKIVNASLTGSWLGDILENSSVTMGLPSGIDPYANALISGYGITGTALGLYNISNSTSASFNGQFIDGSWIGGMLNVQLTGSYVSQSYYYTSSVMTTSGGLDPLDIDRPFVISLQNVEASYRVGDIAKIGVFGRKSVPLKDFGKVYQQEQYVVPEMLPSASYYAIKDNQTEEFVLDFDNYTMISCEYPYGNYFILDTSNLQVERYYRIIIKTCGTETYTIDTGKMFKIIR